MRLIGDGEDGTGVWTALTDPMAVKKALEKRAAQRRTERRFHEEYFGGMLRAKMAARATMKAAAGGGTAATRQLKAALRKGDRRPSVSRSPADSGRPGTSSSVSTSGG